MIYAIAALALLDVILLYFLSRQKPQIVQSGNIKEITEERQYLMELRESIQTDLENTTKRCQNILQKVSQTAMEAEQEVKQGSKSIAKELEIVVDGLTKKFEKPLSDMKLAQNSIDGMMKRLAVEKSLLKSQLSRVDEYTELMKQRLPMGDLVQDIREKRYQDARKMIAKGHRPIDVASELNLPVGEVELIAGLG